MNQRRFRPNTEVTLRRTRSWTGSVVRSAGDMTLVAWTTGTIAGETKWTDTAGLDAVEEPATADDGQQTCQELVYVGGWDYVEECGAKMPCDGHTGPDCEHADTRQLSEHVVECRDCGVIPA